MLNLQDSSGSQSKIAKAVFHTKWQNGGEFEIYYDVALLFLENPFTFSQLLQPICLTDHTYNALPSEKEGDSVTTAGWGCDDDDVVGQHLTVIDVTIGSNQECNTKYRQTDRRSKLSLKKQVPDRLLISTQYCADNNINEQVGTCHGDSGGPSFGR